MRWTDRACWLIVSVALVATPAPSATDDVVRVSWMLDGTGGPARHESYITIHNGHIGAVSSERPREAVRLLDFSGNTAIPGLVDAHGHLVNFGLDPDHSNPLLESRERDAWVVCNARLALAGGVTTIRDAGTYDWVLPLRRQLESVGPRWIVAGRQMVKRAPDAYMSAMFVEFDGAPEARSVVRRLRDDGADFIKLRLTRLRPLPALEEVRAIVEEAHRLGLTVAVHTDVPHDDAVHLALAGGVDTLEHNAVLRLKDKTVLADIVPHGIVIVPGMANWEARMETLSRPPGEIIEEPLRSRLPPRLRQLITQHAIEVRAAVEKMVEGGFDPGLRRQQALKETRDAYEAGVLLATGPDTGVSLMPHGRVYKDAYWLAEAGLTIEQVVRAATLNGARAAGIDKETGSLEVGKLADILIVKGNLTDDYRRLKDVVLVVRSGRVVFDSRTPYVVGCQ